MGQRYVELPFAFTGDARNISAILHVSQLPPNPAIISPGPALMFVVVKGVPSVGVKVMLGSGQLGVQQVLNVQELPLATVATPQRRGASTSITTRQSTSLFNYFGLIALMIHSIHLTNFCL